MKYFILFICSLFFQKKSRQESSGAGSGVEIIVNEPYVDGPGGDGQYTQKVYHIGSHLPSKSKLYCYTLFTCVVTSEWIPLIRAVYVDAPHLAFE